MITKFSNFDSFATFITLTKAASDKLKSGPNQTGFRKELDLGGANPFHKSINPT